MKHISKNYVGKTDSVNGKSDCTCNSQLAADGLMQRKGCCRWYQYACDTSILWHIQGRGSYFMTLFTCHPGILRANRSCKYTQGKK